MGFKINKFFLLIILFLLQSCSGGRIGNFLESSFRNIEEPKTKDDIKNNLKNQIVIKSEKKKEKIINIEEPKTKDDIKNNLKNQIVIKSEKKEEEIINIEKPKTKDDIKNNLKNQIVIKSKDKSKNNKQNTKKSRSTQNRKIKSQSYKIIFILKDVDPKDPIEELSTILRNSDVNFEIEKIERFFDSQNKNIKKN